MTDDEREEILNSMYPIGQERWVKIKYLDRDKAMQAFRMYGNDHARNVELHKDAGYEVVAIGIRDEYTPQIAALVDLKQDIIAYLVGRVGDHELEQVNQAFKAAMENLKRLTIKQP